MNFVERILRHYEVSFLYEVSGRNYLISGRENLEKLQRIGITELHSKKHAKFLAMLDSYKQRHYQRDSLPPLVLGALFAPMTTHEVAKSIERGDARAYQVLSDLRRREQIEVYKVRSTYYWIRTDQRSVVISLEKSRILDVLIVPRRPYEISVMLSRDQKTIARRLTEMARLGLVEKVNSNWRKVQGEKRVIVK